MAAAAAICWEASVWDGRWLRGRAPLEAARPPQESSSSSSRARAATSCIAPAPLLGREFLPGERVLALSSGGGWWPAIVESHIGEDVSIHWDFAGDKQWDGSPEVAKEWCICVRGAGAEVLPRAVTSAPFCRSQISRPLPMFGLDGLCVRPDASPSWCEDALRCFRANGLVVVKSMLTETSELLVACRRVEAEILETNQGRVIARGFGSRGPGRWSMGAASRTGSLLHDHAWARLLNSGLLLQLLERVMPHRGRCISAGGDFVCGGGVSGYQTLHSDMCGYDHGPFEVSFPAPFISVAFVVHPIDADSGPMRAIPGTQTLAFVARCDGLGLPNLDEEPEVWRRSTLHPLEAGDVIVRDVRVLHGGTPNRTDQTRFLPSLEFASQPFRNSEEYNKWDDRPSMPWDIFAELTRGAQGWCDNCVEREALDIGWR
mmetsp:Transcript_92697/g.299896  ORF Transcript_92697/g.299896 Transcript_92697/m.299896 type:complete len:431 (-) Transcript_92697:79-1371(-)